MNLAGQRLGLIHVRSSPRAPAPLPGVGAWSAGDRLKVGAGGRDAARQGGAPPRPAVPRAQARRGGRGAEREVVREVVPGAEWRLRVHPWRAGAGGRREAGSAGAAARGAQQRACAAEPSNQGRPGDTAAASAPGPAQLAPRARRGRRPTARPAQRLPRARGPAPLPGLPRRRQTRSAARRSSGPRGRGADKGAARPRPGPARPAGLRAPRPGRPGPRQQSRSRWTPGRGPARGRGPRPPRMGKSNSKLKPEVVEELTRKTYCECAPRTPARRPGAPPPALALPPPSPLSPLRPRSPPPSTSQPSFGRSVPGLRPGPPPPPPGQSPGRAPNPIPGPIVLGHPAPHAWDVCRLSACSGPPPGRKGKPQPARGPLSAELSERAGARMGQGRWSGRGAPGCEVAPAPAPAARSRLARARRGG